MAVHGELAYDTAIIDEVLAYVHGRRRALGQRPPQSGEPYAMMSASLNRIATELGAGLSNAGWFGAAGTCCVEQGRALAVSVRALAAIDLEVCTLVDAQAGAVIEARAALDGITEGLHGQKALAANLANYGSWEASIAMQLEARTSALQGCQSAQDGLAVATADQAEGITGLRGVLDYIVQEPSRFVLPQASSTFGVDLASLISMASALSTGCVNLRVVAGYGGVGAEVGLTHGQACTEAFDSILMQFEMVRATVLQAMAAKADVYSSRLILSNVQFTDCDEMVGNSFERL